MLLLLTQTLIQIILRRCHRSALDKFSSPGVSCEFWALIQGPRRGWCSGWRQRSFCFFALTFLLQLIFCILYSHRQKKKQKKLPSFENQLYGCCLKLGIFSLNDTCQMHCEHGAITFQLAYQTITVMADCLLWLQHASQDSASWYRYLSVCGLTNFAHWRARLITDHLSKKELQLLANAGK